MKTSDTIALLNKHVKFETIWGMAIALVILNPSRQLVSTLVKQLRSQAKDCPEIMRDVLGEAYDKIIKP